MRFNIEKAKSNILLILFLLSIYLTTQIWFDISIEGIFIMPKIKDKKNEANIEKYPSKNLIKPSKLIINLGEKGFHTELMGYNKVSTVQDRIIKDANTLLGKLLTDNKNKDIERLSIDELDKLREKRSIELLYSFSIPCDVFLTLSNNSGKICDNIKYIDSIIISPDDYSIYMCDFLSETIVKYKVIDLDTSFTSMINIMDDYDSSYCVFLNQAFSNMYSQKVVIPISLDNHTIPVLTVKNEVNNQNNIKEIINQFMDYDTARSIIGENGTTIYTDGQDTGLRIEKSGIIEYIKYNTDELSTKTISESSAIKIASDFIDSHIGFPENSYLASISEINQNGKKVGYLIGFKYSFENIPIVMDSNPEINPIEIEIIGSEVKRYKRVVRHLESSNEYKLIKNPIDILNIITKTLSNQSENSIIKDIELSYFEYTSYDNKQFMIPVWVIEVQGDKDGQSKDTQYIVNAESGVILRY